MSHDEKRFLTVDEEGRVFESPNSETQIPLQLDQLQQFYKNLELNEKSSLQTVIFGQAYYVEAFDAPIVLKTISYRAHQKSLVNAETSSGFSETFHLDQIYVDDWDRFYTFNSKKIPMVFSPLAQEQFFEICDAYDDESHTVAGVPYTTHSLYPDEAAVEKAGYWEQVYQEEAKPGWDLNQPTPALVDMLPRLKLPKSRILVLGSGYGHDAAFFAEHGHLVTAVDFSPQAIAGAKERYGHLSNIRWFQGDALNLSPEFDNNFDLVFEHTCFCAINPHQRQKLVKTWQRCLALNGTLFAVLFAMFKFQGPPFGSTEWEIRKRLSTPFQFLFWNRWRKSVPGRMGRELFVYARKKSAL